MLSDFLSYYLPASMYHYDWWSQCCMMINLDGQDTCKVGSGVPLVSGARARIEIGAPFPDFSPKFSKMVDPKQI